MWWQKETGADGLGISMEEENITLMHSITEEGEHSVMLVKMMY